MDFPVTEGTYSKDNYEPNLCTLPDGRTCWMAWAAYGPKGSRAFVRMFDGESPGPIAPISPADRMQTHPICVPEGEGMQVIIGVAAATKTEERQFPGRPPGGFGGPRF